MRPVALNPGSTEQNSPPIWEEKLLFMSLSEVGLHVVSFLKVTGGSAEGLEGQGTPFQGRGNRKK